MYIWLITDEQPFHLNCHWTWPALGGQAEAILKKQTVAVMLRARAPGPPLQADFGNTSLLPLKSIPWWPLIIFLYCIQLLPLSASVALLVLWPRSHPLKHSETLITMSFLSWGQWRCSFTVTKGKVCTNQHQSGSSRAQVANTRPAGRIQPPTLFWHLVSTQW